MDLLNHKEPQDQAESIKNIKPDSEEYSVTMVDTIFADTLSRGMQNAITSQQNAQMASSTSITNACARILQARATTPVTAPVPEPASAQQKGTGSGPKPASDNLKQLGDKLTAIDNINPFSPNPIANPSQPTNAPVATNSPPADSSNQAQTTPEQISQVKEGNSTKKADTAKFKKRALFFSLGVLITTLITAGLYFLH